LARCATPAAGPWHLAIDTGMSRAGVRWDEVGALRTWRQLPARGRLHALPLRRPRRRLGRAQEARFRDAVARRSRAAAGAARREQPGLERRRSSAWTVARPGVFLYGVGSESGVDPEPVAHLRARVVDVRDLPDGETVSYSAAYRAVGAPHRDRGGGLRRRLPPRRSATGPPRSSAAHACRWSAS
jgi:alanine racemase